MKVLSLFSGVGGFDLGLEAAGMRTVGLCEIDKHCRKVLRRHWPDVPLYEDVSLLSAEQLVRDGVFPDLVAFGSPCQDLSVAGKRAGLAGARSGLFGEALRIIREMREATHGTYPTWAVWENVTGALNSTSGRDFAAVLDALADAGAVAIEWAVLDAQNFGVPQRRRRVFLVACFDPAAGEFCPEPLLPVAQGSPRDLAARRAARKDAARAAAESAGAHREPVVGPYTASSHARYVEGVGTLRANGGDLGGGSETLLVHDTPIGFSHTQGLDCQPSEDAWPTLRAEGSGHAVAQPVDDTIVFQPGGMVRRGGHVWDGGPIPTLRAEAKRGDNEPHIAQPGGSPSTAVVSPEGLAVRRLMPVECERLMGWPDDHTRYADDGSEMADTHRYKMCGNGIASPVAEWVGRYVLMADAYLKAAPKAGS